MGELPEMIYSDGIAKSTQVRFGGLNHRAGAGDGELYDMENLTGGGYPLLQQRTPRYLLTTVGEPRGMTGGEKLAWVDGTSLWYGGEQVMDGLTDGEKTLLRHGKYLLVWPDKKYLDTGTGETGSLEASRTGSVTLQDGVYAEAAAEANTIYSAGADWKSLFRIGDAVEISGCTTEESNNVTIIIQEIDGDYLRFYENSFTLPSGTAYTESDVTIARTVPDMDFIFESDNRLWGCGGSTIYASKLGDPFNWSVMDGAADNSYALEVMSAGDFTGACAYGGYPMFFKDDHIYRMYGNKPSNYELLSSATLGVAAGEHKSMAVAGEQLFYLSRAGVVRYAGGVPEVISRELGEERLCGAAGGSDGVRYYLSCLNGGERGLYVYDTSNGLWSREDGTEALDFAWDGNCCFVNAAGEIWYCGSTLNLPESVTREGPLSWYGEFGDFTEGSPDHKGLVRLQLRMELEAGASATVSVQYDSDGVWRTVKKLEAGAKRSCCVPLIPRRCDHYRVRLEGIGGFRLYSMSREYYTGSEYKGGNI